jgi:methionyl-tRNA synthetase
MLMSAGLPLPKQVFAHGFMLDRGSKMSKTAGNVIDPFPFIERYGIDAVRYYLVREISFGEDGTFSAEGFEARYTGELANELGNLLSRVVRMVERYRGGQVPVGAATDAALAGEVETAAAAVEAAFDRLELTRALDEAWTLVRRLNRLVEERAPWALAKDPARDRELDETLATLVDGLRCAAILLWPFIPGSAERVLSALGEDPGQVTLARARLGAGDQGALVAAPEGGGLFPRVEVPA